MKGSQRSDARSLASHLLNARENETIALHELHGFLSEDLHSALLEVEALAPYTKCQQPFFHVSISPPTEEPLTPEQYRHGAALIESRYPALKEQPRAMLFHIKRDKQGILRHHAHVVWSRIDAVTFKAVNLSYFKLKLRGAAKELTRACGLSLPKGLENSADRDPLNYSYPEWQQCQRLKADPRNIKAMIREAYDNNATMQTFAQALATHGLYLAQGDRRGFVAVQEGSGEILSLSRYAGVKAKDLTAKYGDPERLPTVAAVREKLANLRKDEAQGDQTTPLKEGGRTQKKRAPPRRGKRRRLPRRQPEPHTRMSRSSARKQSRQQRYGKRLKNWGVPVIVPDEHANDIDAPVTAVKALLSFDLR